MCSEGFYTEDHEDFRSIVKDFVHREVLPNVAVWKKNSLISREIWVSAGSQGLLGISAEEKYGGSGLRDFRYRKIIDEELCKVGALDLILSFNLQDDLVIPYINDLANENQKNIWLSKIISGNFIGAFAVTESECGSDLSSVKLKALKNSSGWILNGRKIFIGNATTCDLALVLARAFVDDIDMGLSLFVVERSEGFTSENKYNKIGLSASDTGDIIFDNVNISDNGLLGEVGKGLDYIRKYIVQGRLAIAVAALSAAKAAYVSTVEFIKNRKAFNRDLVDFQNTRFVLAEISTEIEVLEAYINRVIVEFNAYRLSEVEAAQAKFWVTERQMKIVDRCLQLHGGYGYIMDSLIAQIYTASRVLTIFGGTSEIMKEIISKDIIKHF